MKNWSGKVALVLVIVALLFTILGNPVVQERVSTFTPTSLVGREIKDILTVGMSNVAYAAAPDYTCTGTDDHLVIKQALDDLPPTGGKIILFAGNYSFSATGTGTPVSRAINNVTFEGSGKGTSLAYNGSTALISAGSQSGWLFKDMATDGGALNIGSATNSYIISCWIGATYTNTLQDIHVAAADPHTGYILESLVDAKGDIIVATADNTISRLGVGSNTQVLTADSTQATGVKWATPTGGSPDPVATIDLYDEFLTGTLATGDVGDLGWAFTTTAPTYQASVANHPGIRRINTSSTNATANAFWVGGAATNDLIQYNEQWDFTFIVSVPTITTVTVFVGAMDGMVTAVGNQDRYGFEFNPATSAYWRMVTGNGSASTSTNTDVTVVAGTWYKLRVVRTATGVDYYINNVSKGSVTTTLPDTVLSFGFHVQTNAASARNLDCDFFRMTLTGVTR